MQFSTARDYLCPKDWIEGWGECDKIPDANGDLDLSTYVEGHPQVNIVDRLSDKVVPFYPTGATFWTNEQTAETGNITRYESARTPDVLSETVYPGVYLYEQHNSLGRVTKQVYFQNVPNEIGGSYYAVPRYVGTPVANGEMVWLEYIYDVNSRLKTIEGHNLQRINIGYNPVLAREAIKAVW